MASPAADARTSALALAVALGLHVLAVGALIRMESPWSPSRPPPVEFELRDPPPLPPQVVAPPPPEVAPPPKPKLVVRRELPPLPPPAELPPPNRPPPPETPPSNAPPVFGVTMDSVVSGESGMAVPVGNTLMTKPTAPRKQEAPQPYAGGAAQAVQAVPEVNVATLPRVLFEVNSADNYPPDAKALGIEGKVKASITISEKGLVVAVRIIERAGHGFDEVAAQALRRFRFSPALTSDGRPVPFRLTWDYRFSIGD
jgi:protein TonB